MEYKYILIKKFENEKKYRLLEINKEYLCELKEDNMYIKFNNAYFTAYYRMDNDFFNKHFISLKKQRKLKLKNLNEKPN